MTVCLANRQRARMFVEYNSTRRKKERTVSAESATRDRTGDGTDGKRRRMSNARRDGSARQSRKMARAWRKRRAELRATKRENGSDKKETSSG